MDSEENRNVKGFFAIDRKVWLECCVLGMNEPVSFLVLASGTGGDNSTTAWSVNAVEKYTGISRGRAKNAVESLLKSRLIIKCKNSKKAHPRYKLRSPKNLREDAIWLPNTLVIGVKSETPPVELLRQTGEVGLLQFFVELYAEQNLAEYGGISRDTYFRKYSRESLYSFGQFTVWGFVPESLTICWTTFTEKYRYEVTPEEEADQSRNAGFTLFEYFQRLTSLGLVEMVPYLFDNGAIQGEIIIPVHDEGAPGSLERDLGIATLTAGRVMLPPRKLDYADDHNMVTVPVLSHYLNASLFGLARLRYRPHTALTAAWHANLTEQGGKHLKQLQAVIDRYGGEDSGAISAFR